MPMTGISTNDNAPCVYWHHEGPITGFPETPQTLLQYGTNELKGGPQLGPDYAERRESFGPHVKVFPVSKIILIYSSLTDSGKELKFELKELKIWVVIFRST